ncbi:hypothetical protein GNI_153640 [Gregarina niphandrodes]|uniref:Uncharacterized protein n=1 Tax=Gregarina niphandrodes TaxID=110365 RepID=A0A023AZB2_GRENI|nr:hypothetical protein GNI_153640 [Gregarina niphandrodes]EZG44027.1 hypothetical protein GNI_153640 [Gregarina niphandrodes]|eukprot:XP_011132838.1 hypothetical protein GNI_153640 [Gregarina niphandrodes]
MQEQVDGVTVAVMRPVDPSELAELMARVPKEWQPVLQESAGWKTAHWNDGGGLEVTQAKPIHETKSRPCKAACVLGVGAAVQNQLRQLYAGRSFDCEGQAATARDIGTLRQCICDVASVACEVTAKSKKTMHEVTFTDLEAPLARVADIFSDYPKEVYDVKNCGYECWMLAPDTKRTVRANRVAARRAIQNSPSTSKRTEQKSANDLTRDDVLNRRVPMTLPVTMYRTEECQ